MAESEGKAGAVARRLRHLRPYRVARVALAAALGVQRYLRLMLCQRLRGKVLPEAAWDRAHQEAGQSLRRIGIDLRGAFVKVCQVAGARADFFPPAFTAQLRGFFAAVPARPLAELRPFAERQLGRRFEEVFAAVDEEPLAAASLAQVHRARLRDGTDVVVKIQYPEAQRLFRTDLASVRRVAAVAARLDRRVDPRPIVDEVARFVTLELDFAREATSCERLRRALAGNPAVRIPRVYTELSGERLLVLEYLDGVPITETARLSAAGFELRALAERVAEIYAAMIFDVGFFQGDPHPGNLLVLADGSIGLLDFGLAKELPPGFPAAIARLVRAVVGGDAKRALDAARAIGFGLSDDQGPLVTMLIRMMLGDYGSSEDRLGILNGGPVEQIPADIALVARTFIILNGLSHMLVPGERVIPLALMRNLMSREPQPIANKP